MQKILLYGIAGGSIWVILSAVVTGVVTRNVVQKRLDSQRVPVVDKECNPTEGYGNVHQAPAGFLWGVGQNAYQVEGDYEGALSGGRRMGRGWSNWDYYTHNIRAPLDGTTGDNATKFLEQIDSDLKLYKEMGANEFRFSLAWTRLIPSGYMSSTAPELEIDSWFNTTDSTGTPLPSYTRCQSEFTACSPWKVESGWNQAAEDMYRGIVKKVREYGMVPIVSIYDGVHPLSFCPSGGWRNEMMIPAFIGYVREVMTRMSDLADLWILVDDPQGIIDREFAVLTLPASAKDPNLLTHRSDFEASSKMYLSMRHNLVRGIHACLSVVSDLKRLQRVSNDVRVGVSVGVLQGWVGEGQDTIAGVTLEATGWQMDLVSAVAGSYPRAMREIWTQIFGDEGQTYAQIVQYIHLAEIAQTSVDFIAVNYHWPVMVRVDATGWLGIATSALLPSVDRAHGLLDFLRLLKLSRGNIPVLISEDGLDVLGEIQRCEYLAGHVRAVMTAVHEGCNVLGYNVVGLSGLEYLDGFTKKRGVIEIEGGGTGGTLKRSTTHAYKGMQEIIQNNGVIQHHMCNAIQGHGNAE